ncbi:MAG: hypothetical protein NTX03_09605 [Bacteroidetes bacterium]|nr:hypothetical protein [Bacteroidota bacterium]
MVRPLLLKSFYISIIFLAGAISCKKSALDATSNDVIPQVNVNFQVDINNPIYSKLTVDGGYVYVDGEGARGIILVHDFSGEYFALERNCPYQPSHSCAQVTVEKSGVSIKCGSYKGSDFTACCGSQFKLNGDLLQGPSKYSLKQYTVTKNGSLLSVTN